MESEKKKMKKSDFRICLSKDVYAAWCSIRNQLSLSHAETAKVLIQNYDKRTSSSTEACQTCTHCGSPLSLQCRFCLLQSPPSTPKQPTPPLPHTLPDEQMIPNPTPGFGTQIEQTKAPELVKFPAEGFGGGVSGGSGSSHMPPLMPSHPPRAEQPWPFQSASHLGQTPSHHGPPPHPSSHPPSHPPLPPSLPPHTSMQQMNPQFSSQHGSASQLFQAQQQSSIFQDLYEYSFDPLQQQQQHQMRQGSPASQQAFPMMQQQQQQQLHHLQQQQQQEAMFHSQGLQRDGGMMNRLNSGSPHDARNPSPFQLQAQKMMNANREQELQNCSTPPQAQGMMQGSVPPQARGTNFSMAQFDGAAGGGGGTNFNASHLRNNSMPMTNGPRHPTMHQFQISADREQIPMFAPITSMHNQIKSESVDLDLPASQGQGHNPPFPQPNFSQASSWQHQGQARGHHEGQFSVSGVSVKSEPGESDAGGGGGSGSSEQGTGNACGTTTTTTTTNGCSTTNACSM